MVDPASYKTAQWMERQGYPLIAVKPKSKHPLGNDWQNPNNTKSAQFWKQNRDHNIGVQLGTIMALDGDIYCPKRVEVLKNTVAQFTGIPIDRLAVRTGTPPKIAILFNVIGDQPIRTCRTATYKNPEGKDHTVEFLGLGAQLTVFGPFINDDGSEHRYKWSRRPVLSELPTITPAQLIELAEAIEGALEICFDDDIVIEGTYNREVDIDSEIWDIKPELGISLEDAKAILDGIPNGPNDNVDWHKWNMVITGVNHEFSGSEDALEMVRAWSEQNPQHDNKLKHLYD